MPPRKALPARAEKRCLLHWRTADEEQETMDLIEKTNDLLGLIYVTPFRAVRP